MFYFGTGKTFVESQRFCKSVGMALPTSEQHDNILASAHLSNTIDDTFYTACYKNDSNKTTCAFTDKMEMRPVVPKSELTC